jgi:sterol desaturase/sphingolipid hydroxylase (fatty acid hydroxylase superfamily)
MSVPWARIENDGYWLMFLAAFLIVALWESRRPWRSLSSNVARRWTRHGTVLVVATFISAVVFRASPVIVALATAHSRWGLLSKPWLPYFLRFLFAILLLDFVRYAMHWSFHAVPFLWRVHHVHHSDPELDLSTGARTHPIETILTQGVILAAVAVLAAPPVAVLAIELLACAQSFFSHANASLPAWLEKPLRCIFVTPDMHRIHHSEEIREQVRNLGDLFPWWDHLFRTYLPAPAAGQDRMVVGLKGFQNDASLNLSFMLLHPFRQAPPALTSVQPSVPHAD